MGGGICNKRLNWRTRFWTLVYRWLRCREVANAIGEGTAKVIHPSGCEGRTRFSPAQPPAPGPAVQKGDGPMGPGRRPAPKSDTPLMFQPS